MPNLGCSVQLSSHYSAVGWKVIQAENVVAPTNGTATRIWIYTDAASPATNYCKLAVYGGNGAGAPLLGYGELGNAPRGQWNSVSVNFPIIAGNSYCATVIDNGQHGINYGNNTANAWRSIAGNQFSANYSAEPLSSLQDTAAQNNSVSLYLEYAEAVVNTWDLTLTNDGHGTTNPSGTVIVDEADNTALSATASPGYTFLNWTIVSGSAVIADASSSITTVSITSDAVIRANFQVTYGKLLCIGDSITAGYGIANAASYRGVLQDLTTGLYDFVGPYNSTMPAPYDNDHAGVSGETIAQISTRLSSALTTYMQSPGEHAAILILAGTNNVNNDTNTANYQGYVDAIEDMIDVIVAFNPAIKIIIGELPPIDSSADARVSVFNSLLLAMTTTKILTVPLLKFARHNVAIKSNVNWQSQLMYDYLHPNLSGCSVMAFEWYKTLEGNVVDESITITKSNQVNSINNTMVSAILNLSTTKLSGPVNLLAANNSANLSRTLNATSISKLDALNAVNLSNNRAIQQSSQLMAYNTIAVITVLQQSSSEGSVYEDNVIIDTTIAVNTDAILSESESVVLTQVIDIVNSTQQGASNTVNFSMSLMSSIITQCIALANANAGYRITVSAENGEVETVVTTPASRTIRVRFVSRTIKINN